MKDNYCLVFLNYIKKKSFLNDCRFYSQATSCFFIVVSSHRRLAGNRLFEAEKSENI